MRLGLQLSIVRVNIIAMFGDPVDAQITSPTTATVTEGDTLVLNLAANTDVTWSVTGGADAAQFSASGQYLEFTVPPDFEVPTDSDGNNVYVVQVTATPVGGGASATTTITVTVLNELEDPIINPEQTFSVVEDASVGTVVGTIAATVDAGKTAQGFTVVGGSGQSNFNLNAVTGAITVAAVGGSPPGTFVDPLARTANPNLTITNVSGTEGNSLTGEPWVLVADVDTTGVAWHYAQVSMGSPAAGTYFIAANVKVPASNGKTALIINTTGGGNYTFRLSGAGSVIGGANAGIRQESDGSYTVWFEFTFDGGAKTFYYQGARESDGAGQYDPSVDGTTGYGYLIGRAWYELKGAMTEPSAITSGTALNAQDTPVMTLDVTVSDGTNTSTPSTVTIDVLAAAASAPSLVTAPSVSGTPSDGQTLTATQATYNVTPDATEGQWEYSNDGSTVAGEMLGAELVTNGGPGFVNDAGWSSTTTTRQVVDGDLIATAIDGSADRAEYAFTGLTVGATYRVRARVASSTASVGVSTIQSWTIGSINTINVDHLDFREYEFDFVCTSASGAARFYADVSSGVAGKSIKIRDFSVREVLQSTSAPIDGTLYASKYVRYTERAQKDGLWSPWVASPWIGPVGGTQSSSASIVNTSATAISLGEMSPPGTRLPMVLEAQNLGSAKVVNWSIVNDPAGKFEASVSGVHLKDWLDHSAASSHSATVRWTLDDDTFIDFPFTMTVVPFTGNTYYVSATGSDAAAGTSEGTAWRTFSKAKTVAVAGDRIFVKAGNYGDTRLTTAVAGTFTQPIVWIGYQTTPGDRPKYSAWNENNDTPNPSLMPCIDRGTRDNDHYGLLLTHAHNLVAHFTVSNYQFGAYVNTDWCAFANVYTREHGKTTTIYSGMGVFAGTGADFNGFFECRTVNANGQGITLGGSHGMAHKVAAFCDNNNDYGLGNSTAGPTDYYLIATASHNTFREVEARRATNVTGHGGHGVQFKHAPHGAIIGFTTTNTASGSGFRHAETFGCVARDGIVNGDNGVVARDGAHDNIALAITVTGAYYGIWVFETTEAEAGNPNNYSSWRNLFKNITLLNCSYAIAFGEYVDKTATARENIFEEMTINGCTRLYRIGHFADNTNILRDSVLSNIPTLAVTVSPRVVGDVQMQYSNVQTTNVGFTL